MTISIRLEKSLETILRTQVEAKNASLSAYVRDAILEKMERDKAIKPDPFELGKNVFGRYHSGQGNRSSDRKRILKEKLRAKHRG